MKCDRCGTEIDTFKNPLHGLGGNDAQCLRVQVDRLTSERDGLRAEVEALVNRRGGWNKVVDDLLAERDALKARAEAAEAAAKRRLELLTELEWASLDAMDRAHVCPSCFAIEERGHWNNCKLAAELKGGGV